MPAYFVARDLGECVSRLRTTTDNPLMFLSSASRTSTRGLVAHGECHWSRSGSQYGNLARFGPSNRVGNLSFIRICMARAACENLPCFAKYLLRPRLGTLMIILGHGANSLTRLSTTYEAIRDSCISCFSFRAFSDNHVRSIDS